MNFNTENLRAIYGLAVGWGTEVLPGRNPYSITVAADGGWGGNPREKSGYTVGVNQFDFGVQETKYSEQFVSMVSQWVRDQRAAAGMTPEQIAAPVFSVSDATMATYLSTSKYDGPDKKLTSSQKWGRSQFSIIR